MRKGGSTPGFPVGDDARPDDHECAIMLPTMFGEKNLRIELALFVAVPELLPAVQVRLSDQSGAISGHKRRAHMDRGGNMSLEGAGNIDSRLNIHLALQGRIRRCKVDITGDVKKSRLSGRVIIPKNEIQSHFLGVEIDLVTTKFAGAIGDVADLTQCRNYPVSPLTCR